MLATLSMGSIDPIPEPPPTLRFLFALDCPPDWSDRTGMVAILLIALLYAAGLAVHYRWYAHLVPPSLSFDEPVDRPGRR